MNSTFRARWLASSEVISQTLFTSEQPAKNKMAFVGILPQIKVLFGPLVIQLVWYILKKLFICVSVKLVGQSISYAKSTRKLLLRGSVSFHHYSPPLLWINVNHCGLKFLWLKKTMKTIGRKTSLLEHRGFLALVFFFCARNKIIKNQMPSHGKEKHKRLDWATCLWARHNSNKSMIFSDFKSDLSRVIRFPNAGQVERRLLGWGC